MPTEEQLTAIVLPQVCNKIRKLDPSSKTLLSRGQWRLIKREGQDDYWLNIGLVFPHKDEGGFNIMLQAFPFDGKIVCREIKEDDEEESQPSGRGKQGNVSRLNQGASRR